MRSSVFGLARRSLRRREARRPWQSASYLHLRDPPARQSQNAKTCPTLHPSPKIPANLRARVQQPSPTSRPNLPRVLRWNPDADANARLTGGGEYTDFDKWLSPTDDALPGQAVAPKKSRKTKRQVCDLQRWLEAWNIYLAIRIQTAPKTALHLVKYQTIVCQLFSAYPAASALKYDRLFREAAARSKSTTFQWDVLKEDILVWCFTHNPFRARQQMQTTSSTPRQGPAPAARNASSQEGDRSVLTSTGQETQGKNA